MDLRDQRLGIATARLAGRVNIGDSRGRRTVRPSMALIVAIKHKQHYYCREYAIIWVAVESVEGRLIGVGARTA